MSTRVIAFSNHKGGVGKTTSVASIGAGLADKGKRVLLLDLDAQANLTLSLYGQKELERDLADAIKEGTSLPVVNIKKKLDLAPASPALAEIEDYLKDAKDGKEYILKNLLEPLLPSYDFVLLDCPPSLGRIVVNAFVASTEVYIPLSAEPLPLNGLGMIEEVIGLVKKAHNSQLSLSGIFVTKYRGRALEKSVEGTLREKYGSIVFKTLIRENIAIAEAPLSGEDILEYAPSSNGAKDYKELVKEILKR